MGFLLPDHSMHCCSNEGATCKSLRLEEQHPSVLIIKPHFQALKLIISKQLLLSHHLSVLVPHSMLNVLLGSG